MGFILFCARFFVTLQRKVHFLGVDWISQRAEMVRKHAE